MAKSRPAPKRGRAAPAARVAHPSQPMAVSVQIALAALVLLGLLIYRIGATTAAVGSGNGSGNTSSGKPLASCGLPGQPACQIGPGWVPLTSELPGDVAQVIAHDKMFVSAEGHYGSLSLDLPALVHTMATSGSDYFLDDHWVVSVRDATGKERLIFDFVYDRAHQRMRFSGYGVLTPSDPQYGHAFPAMSANTAVAALQRARGVAPMVGRQPELVFFALAGSYFGPQAPHQWLAGGESPLDPMWRIVGADGLSYFVGRDQHVYVQQELPIA